MKKLMFLFISVFLLISCEKEEKEIFLNDFIIGEWQIDNKNDLYMLFNLDNTYNIYHKTLKSKIVLNIDGQGEFNSYEISNAESLFIHPDFYLLFMDTIIVKDWKNLDDHIVFYHKRLHYNLSLTKRQ